MDDELEALYAASYGRLVGIVGLVAGDRAEAEEAVKEAFVRLIGRWTQVRRYDDPEAWLRKVALGKLANSRRKRHGGLVALRRHGAPADAPAPTGVSVDLARAVALLPREQRAGLVLRDLGFRDREIAGELGIPVGTVKSRLSRARAALAPLLREDAGHV